MRRLRAVASLIAIAVNSLLLGACVQKTEYDALQTKLDNTTKELTEAKDSLKKSQDQLTDFQSHRYQTLTTGGRTWRLDTAKGSTCVLLASDQDWKNVKNERTELHLQGFLQGQSKRACGSC
jgi:outer membrane lipoprotein-sorting protein